MRLPTLFSRSALMVLALSGAFSLGLPILTLAGGNSGLTIFSGVDRKDILDYKLDTAFPEQQDRYKLYIPSKKLPQGASKFYISYPKNFKGKFDPDRVRVRIKDDDSSDGVPLKSVVWDKESRFLEITPEKAIDPNTKVTIVLPNVTNPDFGTYYLISDVQASGDIPVRLYVGTWIITISR